MKYLKRYKEKFFAGKIEDLEDYLQELFDKFGAHRHVAHGHEEAGAFVAAHYEDDDTNYVVDINKNSLKSSKIVITGEKLKEMLMELKSIKSNIEKRIKAKIVIRIVQDRDDDLEKIDEIFAIVISIEEPKITDPEYINSLKYKKNS